MTTTVSTAEAIVAAADAWLLDHLTTGEGVFSYSVNGRTVTMTDPEKVKKLRDAYATIAAKRSGRARTFARFDD